MALYSSVADGTKYLSLSSGLIDHNAAYTTMFWVYLVADANSYGHFWAACGSSADNYQEADWVGVDSDGTLLRLSSYESAEAFVDGNGTNLSTGTWYHIAVVREGNTTLKCYLNGTLDITITSPNVSNRPSCVDERMNRLNAGYGCQARYAHFKQWQAALTVDEIKAEMRAIRPLRYTNLNRWTPMIAGVATDADDSLVGTSWTPTGTWAVDQGPPVSWGAPIIQFPFAAAGLSATVNQVTETDIAQAIAKLKNKGFGQVTETDLAQGISHSKAQAIIQALETDLAQAITSVKHVSLAQAVETDIAQTIALGALYVPVSQVTETNLAQNIGRLKYKGFGQVTETDTAQVITPSAAKLVAVLQSLETDLAQNINPIKIKTIGQVNETDSIVGSFGGIKQHTLGQATEIDTGNAIVWSPKYRIIGQVIEIDIANNIHIPATFVAVGQVIETDLAQDIAVVIRARWQEDAATSKTWGTDGAASSPWGSESNADKSWNEESPL